MQAVALLMSNGCDERGACEKFILRVTSLLDYSDRLLEQLIRVGVDAGCSRAGGKESVAGE